MSRSTGVVHSLTGTAEFHIGTFWSAIGNCAIMSRCFPYPPSGYEKKEKHKEKKHKGKKKEEDRDKGGRRTYNDRIEKPIQCHYKDRLEGSWKTEYIKHYKFTELHCQVKNEEKVEANSMVGNSTSLVQRSFDGSGAKAAKLMERVASIRVISASMDSLPWRINGMDRPADILPSLIQSHNEASGSANAVKKERNTANLVSDFIYLGQRGNGGNEQPVDSRVSLQQRSDGPDITTAVEKENCKQNKVVVPISLIQRSSKGMRQSAESSTILAHKS